MPRLFVYDGRTHPDPDPTMTVEQVKEAMSAFFPELATAEAQTTQRGEDQVITFQRRVGTKG